MDAMKMASRMRVIILAAEDMADIWAQEPAAAAQASLSHLSLCRTRTGAEQTWRNLCRCFKCFINRPLNCSCNVESSNVEVIAVFP